MKYSTTYPITAAQMDARYQLTIDGLLTFHENTIARYLTSLGLAAFDLQKQDKTWVISEINLELPAPPAMWTEEVELTVWISEMSPLRVWFDFSAREVHTGLTVARGNSCWSVISMSARTPVSCDGLVPAGELVPELAAGPHRKRTAPKAAAEPANFLEHTVNLIDLDFNGHTNNRRYVQMALAGFGPEFVAAMRPDALNIRFLHESRLGDCLRSENYPTEDPAAFAGRTVNGSGQEICRVGSHWVPREPLPDISEVNLIRH